MKHSFLKKLGMAAVAASMLLGGVASSAMAADTGSSVTETTGKITIHKYLKGTNPDNVNTTGELLADPQLQQPLEGVEFTVTKIDGIDLTTNDGWKAATELAANYKKADSADAKKKLLTLSTNPGEKKSVKTGVDGSAAFDALPIGLYLVEETSVKDAKDNSQPVNVIPGEPFLVTLPMSKDGKAGATTEWNYDIHIYPKNTSVSIEKKIEDENKHLGQEITYPILTGIPAVPDGKELDSYVVIDPLENWLSFDKAQKDTKVTVELVDGSATLTPDTDYKIVFDETGNGSEPMPATVSGVLRVGFTTEGLKKLTEARKQSANVKVKTTVKATIKEMPTDGKIENQVFLAPNGTYNYNEVPNPYEPPSPGVPPEPPTPPIPPLPPIPGIPSLPPTPPSTPPTPPIPSNKVLSKLGSVKLIKHKTGDEATTLEGAEFELYVCSAQGGYGDKLTIDGKDKFTTATGGAVEIKGIQLSNWWNNQAQSPEREYCLKEVKAPKGYELSPEPIKFKVLDNAMQTVAELKIPNSPKNAGFELPFTGSNTLVLATVAGLAVLSGAAFAIVSMKRREA